MIKKFTFILFLLSAVGVMLFASIEKKSRTMTKKGPGTCIFIDENGDGINDNFRDHDGDGIPNYKDPDWQRPGDGSGYGQKKGRAGKREGLRSRRNANNRYMRNFGNGICDGSGLNSTRTRGRRGRK